MASTFARLRRRHETLNRIYRTPPEQRSWWWRLALKFMIGQFQATVRRRYLASIPVAVRLSPTVVFGHDFNGIHLSHEAKLGERVTIMQFVTIGEHHRTKEAPIIGDDVFIGPNACIIGKCEIGNGARIGPGVVLVNATVPPGSLIVNKAAYDLTNDRWVSDRAAIPTDQA